MFTISVCMIVKDEELTLDRILKCVNKFADEIIIVDTGSKDNTKKIAHKYTDKVYDFVWCDDFAKARNFSLSFASKEYLMWLDADDNITDDNINKILQLKKCTKPADIYMFKYVMNFVGNRPSFEFYRERLFRRDKNLRFEGFIHEAISVSGNVEYVDIQIEHRKEKLGDPKRNIRIYENAIKKNIKFSPRDMYYYCREIYYQGHYLKCINKLKQYFKMKDSYTPNIIGAHIILSECLRLRNKFSDSLNVLFDCIRNYSPNSEICCKIADNFEKLTNKDSAIFWYKIATICNNSKFGFTNKDYSDFIPYVELCRLLYSINKEESEKYHNLAKSINPSHPSIIYNEQFFNN